MESSQLFRVYLSRVKNLVSTVFDSMQPFRVVGEISKNLAPVCIHHRTETFVTSCVGALNSFLQVEADLVHRKSFPFAAHLNLLFVSTLHAKNITALTAGQKLVFTAVGNELRSFKRGKVRTTWKQETSEIYLLMVFAEDFLLAFSDDNKLTMWIVATTTKHLELSFPERVTAVVHPSTYLNKILIGFEDGSMQLWNLKSKELVHNFKGWGTRISALEQSPAIDVIAIGLQDGRILLHNIRFDETIVSFHQHDPVTSLAFRTDGYAILASGNSCGQVTLWHLERKKLIAVLKDIHDGPVIGLRFFPSEPVLLSSGNDNSLKIWLFEYTDAETGASQHRLLRSRSGHAKPPHFVRFYNHAELLSAGSDRALRMTSIIQDQQSRELSQGHIAARAKKLHLKAEELKLAPIIHFDANAAKEREWDNVITCHEFDAAAYTWSYEKKAIGVHQLLSPSSDRSHITSVAISVCGNFCFTGAQSGRIEKYNIQSGLHRGTSLGHTAAVTGIHSDSVNKFYFSSSLDKTIRVWDFVSGAATHCITTESPVNRIVLHRDNNLLAAALDDLSVVVYDMDTKAVVRRLNGSSDRITDLCVSPDSRWVLVACSDGTLRVWDLPSETLIDLLQVKKPISSLSFSPLGDFLVTTHANARGISLWSNQTFFSTVFIRPVNATEAATLELPTTPVDGSIPADKTQRMNQALFPHLATLSKVDLTRINAIVNIDVIKERNKPIQPPAAPALAPFFLPTTADSTEQTRPSFVASLTEDAPQPQKKSRILNSGASLREKSKLRLMLDDAEETKNYDKLVEYFAALSPSAVDLELRMLDVSDDFAEFRMLLKFFAETLRTRSNLELIQALLTVFLKAQSDVLTTNKSLLPLMEDLREAATDEWERLQAMFQHSLCMLSSTSGIQI